MKHDQIGERKREEVGGEGSTGSRQEVRMEVEEKAQEEDEVAQQEVEEMAQKEAENRGRQQVDNGAQQEADMAQNHDPSVEGMCALQI